jgi:phosphatidylserine synthase
MKHSHTNHYVVMFFIMLLSGLLSTMNVWVDKVDDIRFSINDAYMTLLMTGWMFLFMGLFYQEITVLCIGLLLIIFNIWSIRTQFLITESLSI